MAVTALGLALGDRQNGRENSRRRPRTSRFISPAAKPPRGRRLCQPDTPLCQVGSPAVGGPARPAAFCPGGARKTDAAAIGADVAITPSRTKADNPDSTDPTTVHLRGARRRGTTMRRLILLIVVLVFVVAVLGPLVLGFGLSLIHI